MTVIDLKNNIETVIPVNQQLIIAIGNFDGIHVGHMELINCCLREKNKYKEAKTAVWTFTQHPDNIIAKNNVVPYLTFIKEKIEIFRDVGLDYAILEDFDLVREYSTERFVSEILIRDCHCITAVCGFNFRYGINGMGTPDNLKALLALQGVNTIIVPPILRKNKVVSSTAIRFFIENGLMEEAANLLGRPYSINFPVVYGKQLGRTIGVPTINQNFPENHIIPKNGIYCCTCYIGEDVFLGVSNIGSRPTVNNDPEKINCETHIINYNGWLYGKNIKVCFYKKLRDEKKFNNLDELRVTIRRDIDSTIDYFSKK